MNTKFALLATACGLVAAASANAQTVVRLTGSTAYRASVHQSIRNVMAPGYTFAYNHATSLGSASQAIFTGTVGGQPVIIKTSWSGSAAGVRDVAQSNNVNFMPNGTTQSTGGTANAPTGTEAAVPDIAMSDVFQSSTIYTTPALVDNQVTVLPFVWVKNDDNNDAQLSNLTNITPGLARLLYGSGTLPLALFTGLNADHGTYVYATGRDPESGTRITAMAESGYGVFNAVQQYKMVNGGADEIGSAAAYPAGTYVYGNNGETSGGTLAGFLARRSTNPTVANDIYGSTTGKCSFVSYLGLGDFNATAAPGGAKALKWNGVDFSNTAVIEGQYSFWCYEHLLHRSSLAGTALNVATALTSEMANNNPLGTASVKLVDMQVSRSGDGSDIGQNY